MKWAGFYGVADGVELAAKLVEGGASVVQVRMKGAGAAAMLEVARAVRAITARAGVALVVNDRLDVALAAEADAVHLGQEDLSLADARTALAAAGRRLAVGISTHSLEQARAAARGGADYVGFGPVYATTTKENPDPVQGIARLAEIVRAVAPLPVVAIGGITPARAAEVAAAGAAAACAIAAVRSAPDVVGAARTIAGAFRGR